MFQSWEIHFGIGAARMLVRLFPTAQGSERRASNSNYNCEYVSHKGGYTVWNRERLAELVRHSRWSSPSKLRYILRHSQRGFRVAVFDLSHAPSLFLYIVKWGAHGTELFGQNTRHQAAILNHLCQTVTIKNSKKRLLCIMQWTA